MEESYLCQRCRSIDWDAAFAPVPQEQWHGRTVLEFRSKLEIRPDSRCRLCLAIASLFGLEDVEMTDKLDRRFSLVAVKSSTLHSFFLRGIAGIEKLLMKRGQFTTWLIGRESGPAVPMNLVPKPRVIVEIRALKPDESDVEFGIPRRTVDFDRLRRWLQSDVGGRRPEPEQRVYSLDLPGMRAIDCELREIVPLTCTNPKYATLSYVWGQSEVPCLTDGKLPDSLPLTIEDSITVCRELGVRYLWVDRYCIQESHKHALIRSMHRIYSESEFTIVAAAGCGPEYGLPGVGNTPRKATTVMDCPIRVGLRQLSYTDNIRSYLGKSARQTRDSIWAKRGWTLQEGMLSKRLCIFLDDQVHFENNIEAQSEQISPCMHTQLGPRLTYPFQSDYWQTVSAFCLRDLSYPEDALNAMSGILSTWIQNTRTFRHIGGLAVDLNLGNTQLLDDPLLKSLTWRVSRSVPRREGFPSWSWTGWLKPEVHGTQIFARVYLYSLESVETDAGDIIHHAQLLDLLRVQHELLDSVKILHITAEVFDICVGPSDSMPSVDQHLYGNQESESEWRAMIVSNGKETVYECEVTRLTTKDGMCLSTSHPYILCKGMAIHPHWKLLGHETLHEQLILVMVWNDESGYYERFGILYVPEDDLMEKKVETIRLG